MFSDSLFTILPADDTSNFCQNESYVTTYGQSSGLSWCHVPISIHNFNIIDVQLFLVLMLSCGFRPLDIGVVGRVQQ
jgi:hypothetical protein